MTNRYFLQIIVERKQYHENTNKRYLKQFENDSINNDKEAIGSTYIYI